MMKRLFDISVTLALLPLWLPLLAAVALVSLCIQGRPVFYRQARAGRNGIPFDMIKVRSMRTGDGPDAERLTRLGRFLRASSLDELPELFHVLSGTMSLVGPRPLPVRYLPRYSREQARRHEVRPGITGWAQINGRNLLDWDAKFAFDVWYVDHRSLALDMLILLRTFAQVVFPSGINADGEATMSEFNPPSPPLSHGAAPRIASLLIIMSALPVSLSAAPIIPAREWAMIRQIAVDYDLDEESTWLLAAIRRYENGRPGLEFGIGGPMNSGHRAHRYRDGVKSFYVQGSWAAGTIRRRFRGNLPDFGRRYNPANAAKWAASVASIIRRLKRENNSRLPGERPNKRPACVIPI